MGGRLFYKGHLVLAPDSKWIPRLLKEFHDTPTGGHAGAYCTYRRFAMNVFWRGMFHRLLQPLPISDLIWEDISMDFITSLPKSKGYTYVLVVVDHLSKY
ncbi:unnamed protein product, partial [Cuscuta europaea]